MRRLEKRLTVGIFLAILSLCSVLSAREDPDSEALRILMRNCAGCHQTEGHPGALFLKKARLSEPETIRLLRKVIETSRMPPAHAKFKSTADGKKILEWLRRKETKDPSLRPD